MKRKNMNLIPFHWLALVNAIAIVGAVMTFGLVATYLLDLQEKNAIVMLAVIPPMIVVTLVSTLVTLRAIAKRTAPLLRGIQAVADGNLDTQLDAEHAGEYQSIYESFNLMKAELRVTKEEMQNFLNEYSHEFKTPITSIRGFSEYLIQTGKGIETEDRMQYLQVIADESARLAELSQNMLLLSKVEACQIVTEKTIFDLSEQIKRCAILLLPQIEKKDITLNIDLPDMTYHGNAELLEQVWINLINNAIKFTPACGEITISGKSEPGTLSVCVADNGIGMDEETKRHIFEKYYQEDNTNAVRGNGIGLSIVHRIITLCNGKIEVVSKPGEGSSFTVILPTI